MFCKQPSAGLATVDLARIRRIEADELDIAKAPLVSPYVDAERLLDPDWRLPSLPDYNGNVAILAQCEPSVYQLRALLIALQQ